MIYLVSVKPSSNNKFIVRKLTESYFYPLQLALSVESQTEAMVQLEIKV